MNEIASCQLDVINSLMGSLLGIFTAAITLTTSNNWVSLFFLVVVIGSMAISVMIRMSLDNEITIGRLFTIGILMFAYFMYLDKYISLDLNTFWPTTPLVIYPMWMFLVELVLREKMIL